jgi:Leucine-rich repeat (LRR) protein
MNFRYCEFLRKIPDVSRIPNLEELDLSGCKNLIEVHPSVGFHDKLVRLRLESCCNLWSFPISLKMRSLKFLSLKYCSSLKNFPEIECQMECLEYINFGGTGIEELPSSIGNLVGVKTLILSDCKNLMTLLDRNHHKLKHLESLYIYGSKGLYLEFPKVNYLGLIGCSKVAEVLKIVEDTRQSMPDVESIEESAISSVVELPQLPPKTNTSIPNDGCSSIVFPKLQMVDLRNCAISESNFFRIFDWCSTLTHLDLSKSDIVTIPPYIRRLVRLEFLNLEECKQLQEILGIPPNLIEMNAEGCVSLEIFLEEARRSPEALFQVANHVLTESKFLIQRDCPSSLRSLDLSGSAVVNLPTWLNTFVGLEDLCLGCCYQLKEIPELPPNIKEVYAEVCTSLERFQFHNINHLPKLELIDFFNCHGLRENMGDDLQIGLLSEVSLFHLYILVICMSYQ